MNTMEILCTHEFKWKKMRPVGAGTKVNDEAGEFNYDIL
jgi:hypothetical protein